MRYMGIPIRTDGSQPYARLETYILDTDKIIKRCRWNCMYAWPLVQRRAIDFGLKEIKDEQKNNSTYDFRRIWVK